MATQGKKNQISGSIGPLIYQQRYGTNIIRTKPARVRQTQATRSSSSEFQYCSKWSKFIRNGLKPLWLGNTDPLVSQRLTGLLYAALQRNTALPKGERSWNTTDMGSISGFEVNSQSLFESYCKVEIGVELTASNTLKIIVPEISTTQTIRYPEGCTDAELVCCITATRLIDGVLLKTVAQHFMLPKSSTALSLSVFESESLPVGCLIVVASQLVFYGNNRVSGRYALNTKKLNPANLTWLGCSS